MVNKTKKPRKTRVQAKSIKQVKKVQAKLTKPVKKVQAKLTKPDFSMFKKQGDVLSFDPGSSNCGQAYVSSTRGVAKPRVHKFVKGKKNSMDQIIERVFKKLDKDKQVQACVKRAAETNGNHPIIAIENQEGISGAGRGKFNLAIRMIRMGTIAGAIAMYFHCRGFKHVQLLAKKNKWTLTSKGLYAKSKVLKPLYKKASMYLIQKTHSETAIEWIKKNRAKAQHVHDAVVQAMYLLT